MAFDITGFFTIIGKYVKTINSVDGYIAAVESLKDEIAGAYSGEDLEDLYKNVPGIISTIQSGMSAGIDSLIADVGNLLLDRDYVTEQLDFYETGTVAVLNALYQYMINNSATIKSSVVSLGGSDVDRKFSGGANPTNPGGLFLTRMLDGVNAPGNGVTAHTRYKGIEGQLARSTTVTAEVISTSGLNSETVQIYPTADETGAYEVQDEEPALGPALVNARSTRSGLLNPDFSTFTVTDVPDSWTVTGGTASTDFEEHSLASSQGEGVVNGLQVNTSGVAIKQALTGLAYNKMYVLFALVGAHGVLGDEGDTCDAVFSIEKGAGTSIHAMGTRTVTLMQGDDDGNVSNLYLFAKEFYIAESILDLSDVYLKVTFNNFSDASLPVIYEVGVQELSYWNGLGVAWINPWYKYPLRSTASIAVSNNNGGVFQTFFRKALAVQLPTADSPSISDSLAT